MFQKIMAAALCIFTATLGFAERPKELKDSITNESLLTWKRKNRTTEYLDLSGQIINNAEVKALANTASKIKVERLNLSNCQITDYKLGILLKGLLNSEVNDLDLSGNPITTRGVEALNTYLSSGVLTHLTIGKNRFDTHSYRLLFGNLSSTNLEHLAIYYTPLLLEEIVELMDGASSSPKLTSLTLQGIMPGESELRVIFERLNQTQIKTLEINDFDVNYSKMTIIAKGLTLAKLKSFKLRHCNQIDDQCMFLLSKTLSNSNSSLKSLDLSYNNLTPTSAKFLAQALPCTRIKNLYLYSNKLGDEGACLIANCLPNSQLTSLEMSFNKIGNAGAIKIAEVLPLSRLSLLSLMANNIGDLGAQAIIDAIPRCNLSTLFLIVNPITSPYKKKLEDACKRKDAFYLG